MNGDIENTPTRAPRKPRPEIQIYRPGMLRSQGESTKSLSGIGSATNEDRPPKPDKLSTTAATASVSSRRQSNDSMTSRGGSGSTTPDAQAMNDKARNRFEKSDNNRRNDGGASNYNSTQSLYDTRQHGGYMDYNGGGGGANRSSNYRNNSHRNNHHNPHHQRQYQQFERQSGNYSRGFNERASMRGDGAIARRPQGSRRQRNDSINSTQSEMPPQNQQLHIDTSFDSASQCGASSMNSLGEAFSFEEMCQNLQNFASMDWSKEVENEFAMQKELEEEEERKTKDEQEATMRSEMDPQMESPRESPKRQNRRNQNQYQNGRNNRRNNRYDESDRESSFGGSIAEEIEEDGEEEDVKSGERTPTSTRSGQSYNPRLLYQKSRAERYQAHDRNLDRDHDGPLRGNDENHHGRRQISEKTFKKEPRRYRGEHDDRDDETSEYTAESHMTSGRLAGRITIVPRSQNAQSVTQVLEAAGGRSRHNHKEEQKIYQKRSQNQSEMSNRVEINRRRQEEIDKNEGKRIREISEKMDKLTSAVKKRDVRAAEKLSELSMELANIYSQIILPDVIYSFTAGIEQKLFRQAFYKAIECLRTGANAASPDARLIRAVTQKLLLNGIVFYENLIATYEKHFHVELSAALIWNAGFPSDEELMNEEGLDLPIGIQKYESTSQKTAIKSLSRHLISLGDLHRYKSLIDGSENYEASKKCYQKSSQLWPSTGHPYNQLGIVVYYSKRVIDEFFYLTRALACSHPYEVAKDRMKQRLDAMRTKISKYQPVLDRECGIVKEQGNTLRKLQVIKQIWIHPITGQTQDGTGERIVDDILSHFMEHSNAKLHRRAVSYLSDCYGLLVTKIGMESFESVSERAFGLLWASLAKEETDFTAEQLVKLAAIFIYAIQMNFEKASESSSPFQLQTAFNTLITFYLILLEHFSTLQHSRLLLPALNIISSWILYVETDRIIETVGHTSPLPSTILPRFSCLGKTYPRTEKFENRAYPEEILLLSFCKFYDSVPVAACQSRATNLSCAVEKVKNFVKLSESVDEIEQNMENSEIEKPKSREQIIEEERDKGKAVIVVFPEYLIPDTNVFIGELQLVKSLLEKAEKIDKFQILVPTIVLEELQSISKLSPSDPKSNSESHDPDRISKAKQAVNWLKDQSRLKTNNIFTLTSQGKRLPSLLMAAEDLDRKEKMSNDDMILSSALKWSESLPPPPQSSSLIQTSVGIPFSHARSCVLITGDRGLTIKSIGIHFACRGISNFVKWIGDV